MCARSPSLLSPYFAVRQRAPTVAGRRATLPSETKLWLARALPVSRRRAGYFVSASDLDARDARATPAGRRAWRASSLVRRAAATAGACPDPPRARDDLARRWLLSRCVGSLVRAAHQVLLRVVQRLPVVRSRNESRTRSVRVPRRGRRERNVSSVAGGFSGRSVVSRRRLRRQDLESQPLVYWANFWPFRRKPSAPPAAGPSFSKGPRYAIHGNFLAEPL